MKTNDINIIEKFVNISIPNNYHLSTEQVKDKPIRNDKGIQIGKLTDADEDYIYGLIYSVASLYGYQSPKTVEICIKEEKENERTV